MNIKGEATSSLSLSRDGRRISELAFACQDNLPGAASLASLRRGPDLVGAMRRPKGGSDLRQKSSAAERMVPVCGLTGLVDHNRITRAPKRLAVRGQRRIAQRFSVVIAGLPASAEPTR